MSIDDDNVGPLIGLPDPDSDPAHARLRAALGETGASFAPRPGWEDRVRARIDADEAAPPSRAAVRGPSRRGWWIAAGALAAAAAIFLVLSSRRDPDGPIVAKVELDPSITFRQGAEVMRSAAAAPGDTMIVRQDAPTARVWIYLDDALISEGGAVHEVLLARPGTYQVVSVVTGAPAPATLDAALASLVRGGVLHRRHTIDVR